MIEKLISIDTMLEREQKESSKTSIIDEEIIERITKLQKFEKVEFPEAMGFKRSMFDFSQTSTLFTSTHDRIVRSMPSEAITTSPKLVKDFNYLDNEYILENFLWAGSNAKFDYFVNKEHTVCVIFAYLTEDDTEEFGKDGYVYKTGYNPVQLTYMPCREAVEIGNILNEYLFKPPVQNEGKKSASIIVQHQNGLDLIDNPVAPFEINFDDHYNDSIKEFNKVMEKWEDHTDPNNRLCILYGPAGTGKTNWIKNYIQTIDREVVYVPPSMSGMVSNPQFIEFMHDNRGALIIFEDAEQILEKREKTSDRGVSDILNLTDGILADFLDLRIIATHNKDESWIDSALRRSGRCYSEYRFDKLSEAKSEALCEKEGVEYKSGTEMTIAEIFNSDRYQQEEVDDDNSFMGFGTS